MINLNGHRYAHMEYADDNMVGWAAAAVLHQLKEEAFIRYENPFEQKWALREKFNPLPAIEEMYAYLEGLADQASEIFGVPLQVDWTRHYAGLFKYAHGDKLDVHVDAGIHPLVPSLRKHVTALLYLNDAEGPLEFWSGQRCTEQNPHLYFCSARIKPARGKVILFENNDYAWHGVGIYHGEEPRMVATVSFLSDRFSQWNQRQRAFFVPRPDEHWSPETWALRDQRAHPTQYEGAYRTSGVMA